jgi:hypothetical protein
MIGGDGETHPITSYGGLDLDYLRVSNHTIGDWLQIRDPNQWKVPVSVLALSTRSRNGLERLGIYYLDRLLRLRLFELWDIKNLGNDSVANILLSLKNFYANQNLIDHKTDLPLHPDIGLGNSNATNQERTVYATFELTETSPIDWLSLPVRTRNALKRNDITTIWHLSSYTKDELISLRGINSLEFRVIENSLKEFGLQLARTYSEKEIALIKFNECESIAELLDQLLSFLRMVVHSERNVDIFHARSILFQDTPPTLDKIGSEFDVTRERIRQIVKKIHVILLQFNEHEVRILHEACELALETTSHADFELTASSSPIFSLANYKLPQFMALCSLFGQSDLHTLLEEMESAWNSGEKLLDAQTKHVMSLRNKLGLIDLSLVMSECHCDTLEDARQAVLRAYPKSVFVNTLALARTRNLSTAFENTLGRQLLIRSPLLVSDAVDGLRRAAKNRGVSLPQTSDINEIIRLLCEVSDQNEILSIDLLKTATITKGESFIVDMIRKSPNGFLHGDEISRTARQEGQNGGSVAAYLSTSPVLRSIDHGCYAVVGSHFQSEVVKGHRDFVKSLFPPPRIVHKLDEQQLHLTLWPAESTHRGGTFIPKSDLKDLIGGSKFSVVCKCGTENGSLELDDQGFWKGWKSILDHGMQAHGISVYGPFSFNLNLDERIGTLLPNGS